MDALKKFIAKKKTDKVFKSAGAGQKLSDGQGPSAQAVKQQQGGSVKSSGHHHHSSHGSSSTQSEEKRAAAAAALARLEKNKKPEADTEKLRASRQINLIKEQARKELEAERKTKEEESRIAGVGHNVGSDLIRENETPRSVDPADYAVQGVYFTCPFIGPEVLSKREIEENIKSYLLNEPEEEIATTSILLIHSCNKPKETVTACVETLCRYLNNIITKPDDVKFQRIRCANAVFQERVAPVVGAEMFLKAAGFVKTMVESEEYWTYSPTTDINLVQLRDTLQQTTALKPELDRNLQVLMPAQVTKRRELPDEFYTLSVEEIKREQKLKSELAERERTLRTKEMRERDEIREQRFYRYGLMRVRFPDGLTLQGTFKAHEKVSDLYNFVQENLVLDTLSFDLIKSGGENLSENLDSTLSNMKLPPSSVLNFKVHSAPAELATKEISYLKPEILELVRSME